MVPVPGPPLAIDLRPGELQSPGTGPFFGSKTLHCRKLLAENMDLSPSLLLQFSWVLPEWLVVGLKKRHNDSSTRSMPLRRLV